MASLLAPGLTRQVSGEGRHPRPPPQAIMRSFAQEYERIHAPSNVAAAISVPAEVQFLDKS